MGEASHFEIAEIAVVGVGEGVDVVTGKVSSIQSQDPPHRRIRTENDTIQIGQRHSDRSIFEGRLKSFVRLSQRLVGAFAVSYVMQV